MDKESRKGTEKDEGGLMALHNKEIRGGQQMFDKVVELFALAPRAQGIRELDSELQLGVFIHYSRSVLPLAPVLWHHQP